jgi:hypothetical protein
MKRVCLGLASVLIALSCKSDEPSPLPTNPTPTVIPSSFVVQGPPPAVGPGETAQLRGVARLTDGTERDVTAEATWTSSQPQIATVEAGVVTGRALGRATIRATYMSRTASLRMVIQPAGTFVLTGNIIEPGPVNVGMATVTVVGGSNQVTASSSGFYELFGVSGTVTLRVSKSGYLDQTTTLSVTQDQRLDLQIRPVSTPVSVAGTYRVTLTVSPGCTAVPDDQKRRTYTAAIEQNSALLRIQLRDATFVPERPSGERNTFEGKVIGSTVTFNLLGGYYYYYDEAVQELLPGGQILGIWGTIVTQAGRTMSGNLVGGFSFREGNRTRGCSASDNPVVFTRN